MRSDDMRPSSKRRWLNIPLVTTYHRQPRAGTVLFWVVFSVLATAAIAYYRLYLP